MAFFPVWTQEGNVLGFSYLGCEQDSGCRAQGLPSSKVKGGAELEMGRKQNFLGKRGEMSIIP